MLDQHRIVSHTALVIGDGQHIVQRRQICCGCGVYVSNAFALLVFKVCHVISIHYNARHRRIATVGLCGTRCVAQGHGHIILRKLSVLDIRRNDSLEIIHPQTFHFVLHARLLVNRGGVLVQQIKVAIALSPVDFQCGCHDHAGSVLFRHVFHVESILQTVAGSFAGRGQVARRNGLSHLVQQTSRSINIIHGIVGVDTEMGTIQ